MPARILNDHNTILIDDSNPSLALRQKQTIATNARVASFSYSGAETPTIALRSSSPCYLRNIDISGSNRVFHAMITQDAFQADVTGYIYDRPVDSGAAWGFKLRDAQGRITFDALGKYGRVATVMNGAGSWTGTAGRDYATTILSFRFRDEILVSSTPGYRHRRVSRTMAWVNGSTVHVGLQILSDIHYPSSEAPIVFWDYGTPSVLVTDVTGY